MMQPDPAAPAIAAGSERLMSLYAGLRGHAWLKKLFSARRNTDLLPLAQTLLTLSDELTQALLPTVQMAPDAADACWQQALAELPPPALKLLADESQLVWTIWKSQLDTNDATAARFTQMMRLAAQAQRPLGLDQSGRAGCAGSGISGRLRRAPAGVAHHAGLARRGGRCDLP